MLTKTKAAKLLLAFVVCSLSAASNAAQGVTFSVATFNDRMGDFSPYSQNAAYFITKGSAQVGIYRSAPYQHVGSICCLVETERTTEYFLKSESNADLVLQVKRQRSGKGPVALSVYNLEGKLITSVTFNPASPLYLVAADRSRKYLALTDGSTITVYDSSLAPVRSQKLASSLTKPKELLLSTGGTGALLIGRDALAAVDFDSRKEAFIQSCGAPGDWAHAAAPVEVIANSYVVLTASGEGCRVDGIRGIRFQTKPRSDLRGMYFTPDLLFVITATSVEALSTTSMSTQALFELIPFYERKFGRNPNEDPFFVQHEFDASTSRLYLRGSGSTGTFFEITVNRPR